MNVIFLDFDGVLITKNGDSFSDIESRIKILAEACLKGDANIVISSSIKDVIDDNKLASPIGWVDDILNLFAKYGIKCIGKTKTVSKRIGKLFIASSKEDEILLYLNEHPEVSNYCVIDDDNLVLLEDNLINTLYSSSDPNEEGLLEEHVNKILNILGKDEKIKTI